MKNQMPVLIGQIHGGLEVWASVFYSLVILFHIYKSVD